ncbi:hypothetical protein [Paludibaculum fermentans]|uniref:Uncharacterized protein n=1 Tax=Paludibaculum fermentans TaxID=1473598 RepID=A0A7S7SI02_PALFE|nr:hypothetical protein [Paludibaculum fermentans]QOY84921.1 hypothetical protein IRI77_18865 [Paludibaculum fermentans]
MSRTAWAWCALIGVSTLFGQPVIGKKSIRPAAPTASAAGLARGSAFRIVGDNLGPLDAVKAELPYPAEIDGVKVILKNKASGTEVQAFLSQVGAFEIHGIVPSATEAGASTVRVQTSAGTSAEIEVNVADQVLGIVTTTSLNGALAATDILRPDTAPQRLRMTAPAHPGATLSILASGFGPINTSDGDPAVEQPLLEGAELIVGGVALPVRYAGRYPGKTGYDQILVDLPEEGLKLGCYVPVSLRAGDQLSNAAFLSIAAADQSICDAGGALTPEAIQAIDEGRQVVVPGFEITDSATEFDFGGESIEFHTRAASGAFYAYSSYELESGLAFLNGTVQNLNGCSVVTLEGTSDDYETAEASGLDAGEILKFDGQGGAQFQLERQPTIIYTGDLGSSIPVLPGMFSLEAKAQNMIRQAKSAAVKQAGQRRGNFPVVAPELTPGTYTLSGTGGVAIDAFTATIDLGAPITWTNKASINDIDRGNPLQVSWTPGPAADVVTVTGLAIGPVPGAPKALGRLFTCQAPANAGGLTVGADILQLMPVTGGTEDSMGLLSVLQSNTPPNGRFKAPLVGGGETEYGQIGYTYGGQKSVNFQ